MNRVMPASRAKLLRLEALGMLPLVFRRRVIPFLAVGALQGDDVPHNVPLLPTQ